MWKKENLRKNFLRVKQIADQNLGRVEKSEVLSEEFQSVEKRVENVKTVSATISKKVSATLKAQQGDVEKRLKKLPETSLSYSLIEASGILGTDTLLGMVCQTCGECQSKLAKEQLQYEINIEKEVLTPLSCVQEADIPAINKVRKQLTKSTLDMDSAKNRLNAAVRQSHVPGTNISSAAAKADTIKDEYEEAMNKVEQVKDCLAVELSNFISKETDHSSRLLALLEAQAQYHKKALEAIEEVIPKMRTCIDNYPNKPVYGTELVEHLRVTGRDIALVFEACIVTLLETGVEEEGLFRIAGSAVKLKKLKACFDAHLIDMEEFSSEPHVIAGALKQYMRELPEPLLTYALYGDFMKAVALPHEQRLPALWTVASRLPKPNYDNFRYLIKFLAHLAEKSDVNKMTPSNIAIVIGPNLLWSQGENAPNMLTTGSLSAIIEAFVQHADYFFPDDVEFHNTSRGSQQPPTPTKLPSGNDLGAKPKQNAVAATETVVKHEASVSQSVPNQSEMTLLQLSGTPCQMAQDESVRAKPCVEGEGTDIVPRLSPGDRNLASKHRINSSSTLTSTNPTIGFNLSDVSYNARSSSVPPTPVTKSFHSDVYSTVFALQSLGDGAWNDYLTKVRAMWDGQFTQHTAPGQTDLAGTSSGVAGGQPSTKGQEIDFSNTGGLPLQASTQQRFGNSGAPSAGPPSPSGQREATPLLPSPTTTPMSPIGGSGGGSPQGGGSGSNTSSTSSLTVTSAESPDTGSSPKVQRRVSRKPAPPPPYAVAVTATYNNNSSSSNNSNRTSGQSQTQSQTWPRNAPLASPESPSESDKEENERVKPCPPEKPPPPQQFHPHHERPTGPPPDRPAGPPPERPKAPPPVVPPGHQRSASTGAMFTVVGLPSGAANGQGKRNRHGGTLV